MVLVKITSEEGIHGWGEIWCNFPNVGAKHRANLVETVFAPLLMSVTHESPEAAFNFLTKETWVLGLQSGEFGPLSQCIAGIEIALCDIYGKQKGKPIWELFGGKQESVAIYASGINPTKPEVVAKRAIQEGYKALKLKIGFGRSLDLQNLSALTEIIDSDVRLMVDANQAWKLDEACEMLEAFSEYDLDWLEEPIASDRPNTEWITLKTAASIPIAAGENIQGEENFQSIINDDLLDVVQPDIAKWGGISKTILIGRSVVRSGKRYCPHYLGGGVGLVASAHALAAVGGDGMLEVDTNTNPLRSQLIGNMLTAGSGKACLGKLPGLGYEPALSEVKNYKVLHLSC